MRTGLAAAALGSAFIAAPAQASVVDMADGHNISVFHNVDFINSTGWADNQDLKVEVLRGGHLIGYAQATSDLMEAADPAEGTPDVFGIEVNHELLAGANNAVCWSGITPDVQPGDEIRVTPLTTTPDPVDPTLPPTVTEGTPDAIIVDDIVVENGPYVDEDGNVALDIHAIDGEGDPLLRADLLASSEVLNTPDFRGAPTDVVPVAGQPGRFTVVFDPNEALDRERDDFANLTPAERRNAIMNGDFAIGIGHVDGEAAEETQLWEGTDVDVTAPAAGCEAAPSSAFRVLGTDDPVIANGSGDLLVNGSLMTNLVTATGANGAAITGGTVTITDGATPTANTITAPLTATGATWTASFTRDQLLTLVDGDLTISAVYDVTGGGTITGMTRSIEKDLLGPAVAVPSLAPGTYNTGATSVTLSAGAGETIQYQVNGSDWIAYNGAIPLSVGTTTLTTRVTDAAGNTTDGAPLRYVINPRPVAAVQQPPAAAPIVVFVQPPSVQRSVFRPLAPSLRATSKRVKRSQIRRNGLAASFVTPAGAKVADAKLYRTTKGSKTLITSKRLTVKAGRRETVKFSGRNLRTGLYTIEVRTGATRSALGDAGIVRLRVVR